MKPSRKTNDLLRNSQPNHWEVQTLLRSEILLRHPAVWTQHETPQQHDEARKRSHSGPLVRSWTESDSRVACWKPVGRKQTGKHLNIPKTFWKNTCLVQQIPPLEVRPGIAQQFLIQDAMPSTYQKLYDKKWTQLLSSFNKKALKYLPNTTNLPKIGSILS